jgi:hypothetical protein
MERIDGGVSPGSNKTAEVIPMINRGALKRRGRIVLAGSVALLMFLMLPAFGQTVSWSDQFGTAGFDALYSLDVGGGDVYGVGEVEADLVPSGCAEDAIVRKYRGSGQLAWSRQFGSVLSSGQGGCDLAEGVAAQDDAVYVGGLLDVSPSGLGEIFDAFVRKYDGDGNEVWTRQFGTNNFARVAGMAADSGAVYAAGQVCGALPGQTAFGSCDAFIRAYDHGGNELWTRQFGATGPAMANEVDVEKNAIVVVGRVAGPLPGQQAVGLRDVFVRTYDTKGKLLWTRQFGSTGNDIAFGVDVEGAAIYVAGDVAGALPPQPFAGGPQDAFVRRYDAKGNEVWTREFGTTGFDRAIRVDADATRIVVVGRAGGVLVGATNLFTGAPYVFAGGSGSTPTDPFVRSLDTAGNELWTRQFGGPSDPEAATGVISFDEDVFISGGVGAQLPGESYQGFVDAFVMKILAD